MKKFTLCLLAVASVFSVSSVILGHDAHHSEPAGVETRGASPCLDSACHEDHGAAPEEAAATEPTAAVWAYRWVTHYNCGWTGLYSVAVGRWNTILCVNCGSFYRAFIPF